MQAKVEQILLPVNLKLYNLVKILKNFNVNILLEFKNMDLALKITYTQTEGVLHLKDFLFCFQVSVNTFLNEF